MLTHRFTELGPWWLVLAIALLDLTAIGRALLRGHGVPSTLAWIFAVLAFPGVGAGAYLLLANPSITRTIRRRARAALVPPCAQSVAVTTRKEDRRIIQLAHQLTGLPATAGNSVRLLMEDETAFEEIEHELSMARETIWAEYYIVKNDETGHRFLDLLAERARAGVSVRLLYDAVGSMGLDATRLEAIRSAGGKVEPFLPLNPLRRRWAMHLRNHRKLIVVDGKLAFTGGMNVGDEYSGRSKRKGQQHFRDSHLRIAGPAVRDFAEVFAEDWLFATEERLTLPAASAGAVAGSVVCPLPSGPDQPLNASAHVFFSAIMAAREHCFLTTPYFIPDDATLRALVTAARSGVDVRILVPSRCDVALVGAAARSFYAQLVSSGVRIFEYRPSMLHAKSIVVDGRWGIVGSANVDMRSFRLNFEIGALVFDPDFGAELASRFLEESSSSDEITLAHLTRAGLLQRVGQGAARLLSPLL